MYNKNGELILKRKVIPNIFNDHFGSKLDKLALDHCYDRSLYHAKVKRY